VEGPVTSPTFTLVRQYECVGAVRQLLHADVYRLERLAEVADLGLGELVEDGGVALVEWGDAAAPALGPDTLTVALQPVADEDARAITVTGRGDAWTDRQAAVAAALAAWAAPSRDGDR
jgi:tRNA threonylcarbamoyladenosine biosynthesis protein TsaE